MPTVDDGLYWPAPTLTSPQTINVSGSGYSQLRNDTDYIVNVPTRWTGQVMLEGGRNIWVRGGPFVNYVGGGAASLYFTDNGQAGTGTILSGRVIDVRSVGMDMSPGDQRDAISPSTPSAVVQLQDMWVYGVHGQASNVHADICQPYTDLLELRVDKFTGSSNYQGFFIPPSNGVITGGASFRRMDLTLSANGVDTFTQPLYLLSGGTTNRVTLYEVYINNTKVGQTAQDAIYPDSTATPASSYDGFAVTFPGYSNLYGSVRNGVPAAGSFSTIATGACPLATMFSAPRNRSFFAVRGRQRTLVPSQSAPVDGQRSSAARGGMAVRWRVAPPRGHRWPPITEQPQAPARARRPARTPAPPRGRRFTFTPQDPAVPARIRARARTLATRRTGRPSAVPHGAHIQIGSRTPAPSRRSWTAPRRGTRTMPVPGQAGPVAPKWPPATMRARPRPAMLRRGHRFDPAWPVTIVPPPPSICYPTVASIVSYQTAAGITPRATTANVGAYSSTAAISAYTSSAAISGYTSSAAVRSYTSTGTITSYTSSAGVVRYTTSVTIQTCGL